MLLLVLFAARALSSSKTSCSSSGVRAASCTPVLGHVPTSIRTHTYYEYQDTYLQLYEDTYAVDDLLLQRDQEVHTCIVQVHSSMRTHV